MKILVVDNHDSFTYNIIELLRNVAKDCFRVIQSDRLNLMELTDFSHVIISPGPMKPADFPALKDVIASCFESSRPLLGICLGHQAICAFFGANLVQLKKVVHGQKKKIRIDNKSPLFLGLPLEIEAGLYHSWIVEKAGLPDCLTVTGLSEDGHLMAVVYPDKNIFGIQFHPESFMTTCGNQILINFLNLQHE